MKKIERMVPVALTADNGMFSTRALSSYDMPEIVMPAFSMMSGP